MKKTTYILLSALIALALVASGTVLWIFFGSAPGQADNPERKNITIYDAQGNQLVSTDTGVHIYDTEYWAYLELVLSEMTDIIAEKESCTPEEARSRLFAREYQIYTAFDSVAFESIKAVKTRWGKVCNTAGAITDLNGRLLAVYCTDTNDKQVNYTLERRSPYSSFKALSVYTPAVEKGIVNWATMYQDVPYKQVKDDSGVLQNWPGNANGIYSNKQLPVYEALRTSLNTIAVHCLADLGVSEAMDFLKTNFNIPLTEETYVVENYGEEEVIGNIALGYLETGITPVEMAGYYQIFATGGNYIPPKTIDKIQLAEEPAWYTRQVEPKQVVRPATADTVNKLLQGVVAPGGTGEMAWCGDIEVAGKTGTGDNYADNWFVGVTPGYSLAMWHGQHDSNQAEEMFAMVIDKLYSSQPNANRKFITHQNLQKACLLCA